MRLFSVPSGSVDRKTRAWLLTIPFDLALSTPPAVVAPSFQVSAKGLSVLQLVTKGVTTVNIEAKGQP